MVRVVPIRGISINVNDTIFVNQGISATVSPIPLNGSLFNIIWSIDNTSVATVDSSGNITLIQNGTFTLTAVEYEQTLSDANYSATATITVLPYVTTLSIVDLPSKIYPGYTIPVILDLTWSDGSHGMNFGSYTPTIEYSCSNTNVITADASGNLRGLATSGTTQVISVTVTTSTQLKATASIIATNRPNTDSTPLLIEPTIYLKPAYVGKNTQAYLVVEPKDSRVTITWYTTDPNIVFIDEATGRVTGLSPGTFNIIGLVSDLNSQYTAVSDTIECIQLINSIIVSPASIIGMQIGDIYDEKIIDHVEIYPRSIYTLQPSIRSTILPTWSSSNPLVATVTVNYQNNYNNGRFQIQAVGNGTAIITIASSDMNSATASMYVSVQTNLVTVTTNLPDTILIGKTFQAQITALKDNNTPGYFSAAEWYSTDPTVLYVSNRGLVTGIGSGTATIKLKVDGQTGYFKRYSKNITVTQGVSSIIVSPTNIYLSPLMDTTTPYDTAQRKFPNTIQLNATVLPESVSTTPLSWTSSNPLIISVDGSGNIHALKKGTSKITVMALDGNNVSTTITVNSGIPIHHIELRSGNVVLPQNYTVNLGKPIQITVKVYPSTAQYDYILWNPSVTEITGATTHPILQVTDKGLLVPCGPGTSTFTVTAGNEYDASGSIMHIQQTVTVISPILGISLPPLIYGIVGRFVKIKPTIFPPNATNQNLTWITSSPFVSDVSSSGRATVNNEGVTRIKVITDASATLDRIPLAAITYLYARVGVFDKQYLVSNAYNNALEYMIKRNTLAPTLLYDLLASIDTTSLTLTWSGGEYSSEYFIDIVPKRVNTLITYNLYSKTATITGLKSSTLYNVSITGTNFLGSTPNILTGTFTTAFQLMPIQYLVSNAYNNALEYMIKRNTLAPTLLSDFSTVFVDTSSFSISWQGGDYSSEYIISVSPATGTIAYDLYLKTATFTGLDSGTPYTVSIQGKNILGTSSLATYSVRTVAFVEQYLVSIVYNKAVEYILFENIGLPTPLSLLNAPLVELNGFTLSWQGGKYSSEYIITLSPSPTNASITYNLQSKTATFTGLDIGTPYTVSIQGKNIRDVTNIVTRTVRTLSPIQPQYLVSNAYNKALEYMIKAITLAPTALSGFSTAFVNTSSFTISWQGGDYSSEYIISVSPAIGSMVYDLYLKTATFTGLDSGTPYSVSIQGKNTLGTTSVATYSVTTVGFLEQYVVSNVYNSNLEYIIFGNMGIPQNISNLTESLVDLNSFTLSWQGGKYSSEYIISVSPSSTNVSITYNLQSKTATFTGLELGTPYTVSIQGKNIRDVSNIVTRTVRTLSPIQPQYLVSNAYNRALEYMIKRITLAPTALSGFSTAFVNTSSFSISWQGGDYSSEYIISLSPATGSMVYDLYLKTATFSGLDSGTPYTVSIQGRNTLGTSSLATYSVTTVGFVEQYTVSNVYNSNLEYMIFGNMGTPENISTLTESLVELNSFTLTWQGGKYSSEYVISITSSPNAGTITYDFLLKTATITGLNPDTSYTISVTGKNTFYTGNASTKTVKTLTPVVPPPAIPRQYLVSNAYNRALEYMIKRITLAPTALSGFSTAFVNTSSFSISWQGGDYSSEYIISVSPATGSITYDLYLKTATFSGLDPGTPYTVSIQGRNTLGTSSLATYTVTTVGFVEQYEVSNVYNSNLEYIIFGNMGTPENIIQLTESLVELNSFTISWQGGKYSSEYIISITSSPNTGTITYDFLLKTATITGLNPDTSYTISVRGKNTFYTGNASTKTVKTLTPVVPPPVIPRQYLVSNAYNRALEYMIKRITLAPTGLSGFSRPFVNTSSFTISWQGGDYSSEYIISLSPATGSMTYDLYLKTATFTGLDYGTPYIVSIQGRNTLGTSSLATYSVTTVGFVEQYVVSNVYNSNLEYMILGNMGTPENISTLTESLVELNSFTLTWQGGKYSSEYLISITSSPNAGTITYDFQMKTATITGLNPDTSYTISVTGKNTFYTGNASTKTVKTLTPVVPPPVIPRQYLVSNAYNRALEYMIKRITLAPTALSGFSRPFVNTSSFSISWQGGDYSSEYIISLSPATGSMTYDLYLKTATFTGLDYGTPYTVSIQGRNTLGTTTLATYSVTTVGFVEQYVVSNVYNSNLEYMILGNMGTPENIIQLTESLVELNSFTLTWQGGKYSSEYVISITSSPSAATITYNFLLKTATITGLNPDTSYTISVIGKNTFYTGNASTKTVKTLTPVVPPPPPPIIPRQYLVSNAYNRALEYMIKRITLAPTGLSGFSTPFVNTSSFTISWQGGDYSSEYIISLSPATGSMTYDLYLKTATFTGLDSGTPYTVSIQGRNTLGTSSLATYSVTTVGFPEQYAVSNVYNSNLEYMISLIV